MIRRSSVPPFTSIRADIRARVLDALKRVTDQEQADAAAERRARVQAAARAAKEADAVAKQRALAKAAGRTANGTGGNGWRMSPGGGMKIGSTRRPTARAS